MQEAETTCAMGCDQEVISSQGKGDAFHRARLNDEPGGHALIAG